MNAYTNISHLASLYMLSSGMSVDEVLDPYANTERKSALSKEFFDQLHINSEEEYTILIP